MNNEFGNFLEEYEKSRKEAEEKEKEELGKLTEKELLIKIILKLEYLDSRIDEIEGAVYSLED